MSDMRRCRVTFPGCAPYECPGALDEAHAVELFKTEWCYMGAHAGQFLVEWLEPTNGEAVDDVVPKEEPAPDDEDATPLESPPVESLDIGGDAKDLREEGIATVEDLQAYLDAGGELTDIKGIGPAGAAKILKAMNPEG